MSCPKDVDGRRRAFQASGLLSRKLAEEGRRERDAGALGIEANRILKVVKVFLSTARGNSGKERVVRGVEVLVYGSLDRGPLRKPSSIQSKGDIFLSGRARIDGCRTCAEGGGRDRAGGIPYRAERVCGEKETN